MLTREKMVAILKRGESVLYQGKHITTLSELPPAEQIHADQPDELRKLLHARESQIAELTAERDRLASALRDAEFKANLKAVDEQPTPPNEPIASPEQAPEPKRKK